MRYLGCFLVLEWVVVTAVEPAIVLADKTTGGIFT